MASGDNGETPSCWPFGPHGVADPYPAWERLRATAPVYAIPAWRCVIVTGHAAASSVLADPRCRVERPEVDDDERAAEVRATLRRMVVFCDPPRHDAVRRLLVAALAPARIDAHRHRIAGIARDCVANVADRLGDGTVDVLDALARPVVDDALAAVVGLPPDVCATVRAHWLAARFPTEPRSEAAVHVDELHHSLLDALGRAGESDDDTHDLAHRFATALRAGELADDREVTANLLFIVNTAHRDLTQAVALALLTLCRHPELVREWHDNPERIDDAVDELLRLETPLQFVTRVTADELRIDDVIVPAGWTVLVMLGAANRDPEQFPDPDHLDSRNHSRPAIGFGHGIHRCPGAGFSRIVVAAVVAAVLEHASQLELVEPPLWATSRPEMRGLDRLVVRW